jgi:hypothetical protein
MATYTSYGTNGGVDNETFSGTDLDLTYPTGIAKGETLFAHFVAYGLTGSTNWQLPSGWTLVDDNNADTQTNTWMLCMKIADGTESGTLTVSLTSSSTADRYGIIHRFTHDTGYTGDINSTYGKITREESTSDIAINLAQNNNPDSQDALAVIFSILTPYDFLYNTDSYSEVCEEYDLLGDSATFGVHTQDIAYNGNAATSDIQVSAKTASAVGMYLYGKPNRRIFIT